MDEELLVILDVVLHVAVFYSLIIQWEIWKYFCDYLVTAGLKIYHFGTLDLSIIDVHSSSQFCRHINTPVPMVIRKK